LVDEKADAEDAGPGAAMKGAPTAFSCWAVLFLQGVGWAAFASAEARVRSFRFFGPAQRVWRACVIAPRARSASSAAVGFSL
jgi:hypothetical protein